MPSKSAKQARFMRACDNGWTPPGNMTCPPKEVSHEFVIADQGVSDKRRVEHKGYRKRKM